MNSERWQKVKELFDAVLELAPRERKPFLVKACDTDDNLRREVEKLLDSFEDAESFMEQPAAAEVASVIIRAEAKNIEPGKYFGHYEIIRQIGAGGMGEVYLAQDKKLDRRVALKILPEDLANDTERMRRFVLEAKSASALNHPNIITIHEIGESNGVNYIATEFIEGETLSRKFKSEPLKLRYALKIAVQIASALDTAHSAGIVHRDIKPDNLMIRPDGLVKILDFGIAKLNEKKPGTIDAEAATAIKARTITGMIIGTASYMSPEQAAGKAVDARSDIFSFGIVLYEMITGRQPFEGDTMMEIIGSILHQEPAPVSQFLSADAPREIERIVDKTLRKDRDERYQTAKDLLIDLKDAGLELEFQNKFERTAPPQREDANTQILSATTTDTPRTTSSAEYVVGEVKKHKFISLGVLAALIVALAAVGYFSFFAAHSAAINSIAVLPFVNESGNADVEYLSDGMTETLINSLSQLPKLLVKARSSVFRYKGKETDAKQVGADLNVQAILNGRVVQRNDELTLYLSLVDAATENQIWGKQYNQKLSDLVSLQNEIARDVSNNLQTRLSGAEQQKLTKNYTENSEAYQLYLKGRYYWFKFPAKGYEKSRDYFQQAIDADPTFALAYVGLADYYGFGAANGILPPDENWLKAEAAAKKALELDESLGETHNSMAGVRLYFYRDWAGAEKEFKRGIELSPNFAEIHNHYGLNLIDFGQSEEALAQMKKALDLEPLSLRFNRNLARIFYWMRDYDRAVEQYRKTIELDPNDGYTHEILGDTYEQKGMQKEAIAEWSKALTLAGNRESAATLERAFAASGFNAAVRDLWQKKLEQLNEKAKRGEYVPAMNYALAYTRLEDKEQAFAWLAKAEQERNRMIFDVKLDPIYDSLRAAPRFQDLIRRVGLPE